MVPIGEMQDSLWPKEALLGVQAEHVGNVGVGPDTVALRAMHEPIHGRRQALQFQLDPCFVTLWSSLDRLAAQGGPHPDYGEYRGRPLSDGRLHGPPHYQ